MANAFNYAQSFESILDEAYKKGLLSTALSKGNDRARFLNHNTLQIPSIAVGGYGDHKRSGGWNRKDVKNTWQPKTLTHDRDVEFLVDVMDVDETNQAVAAAKTTGNFTREQAIPELDSYRFSKLYAEFVALGGVLITTALTAANILDIFDTMCRDMADAEVPEEGRVLYATPAVIKTLKAATGLTRNLNVQTNNGEINRRVTALDNVTITEVPSGRMKTLYDFTDGCKPAATAKQIHMILVHPEAVIAPIKHSAINFFAPGEHSQGDGYLYQNRMYTDLFVLKHKVSGIQICAEATI